MNYLYNIISENLLYALGWTVIHSLWQGVLIALILVVALTSMEKKSAKARYLIANIGLVALLFSSLVTFFLLYQQSKFSTLGEAFIVEKYQAAAQPDLWQNVSQSFIIFFNQNLPLIVSVWLVGVFFFFLKMVGGLLYIQYLKKHRNQPMNAYWQQKMQLIAQQLPIKKTVALLESAMVKVPIVIGYLKPIILMPIGTVNGLSEEQVEAIFAHELAHIYRNDFLLNILQSFVKTLYYYHPAVWWICGNIRLERENCCDDLAVQLCGCSLSYAKALVSLQEMHAVAPSFAMAFSTNKNQLLHRVQRILNQPQSKFNIMEKLTATTLLLVTMIVISFGANTETNSNDENHIEVNELDDFNSQLDGDKRIMVTTYVENDSIPKVKKKRNRQTYIRTENGHKTEVTIENGEVLRLVLNGKEIKKANYDEFEKEIVELRKNMAKVQVPPMPPMPRNNLVPPPPPPPPPHKSFQSFNSFNGFKKVVTKKSEGGKTIILVEENRGKNPIEIEIEEFEEGNQVIVINGQEIKLLDENHKAVIEKIESNPFLFPYDKNQYYDIIAGIELAEEMEIVVNENRFLQDNLSQYFSMGKTTNRAKEQAFRQWNESFQTEREERIKDGNISHDWMNKKRAERGKAFPNSSFLTPELFRFEGLTPDIENETIRLWTTEKLDLKQINERELIKTLEKELRLDGLIHNKKLYRLELNERNFKINGKKQSPKKLKKYLKLLKKQKKQRMKVRSRLS